jgi:hypothetical protein
MKIELKEIVEINGKKVLRVTTVDERWYIDLEVKDRPFPSMTWISGYYPKGKGFYIWLSQHGWDEAQAITQDAADKGSRVHHAIDALFKGATLHMEDRFPDSEGVEGEFSLEEWECVMAVNDWWNEMKKLGAVDMNQAEKTVYNRTLWYAGTQDRKIKIPAQKVPVKVKKGEEPRFEIIPEQRWIFDFKTGQNVWPSHEIQLTGYKHCDGNEDVTHLGIVQIGYRANKRGWKVTEVQDQPALLNAAYTIWKKENDGKKPSQKDYPISISFVDGETYIQLDTEASRESNPA